ncbi:MULTISPECIES: PP2C family protein-serine/threonine phosphatase [Thermomonosporaceae]|uniref:PP2C family protein-serine/threonine phosphatase n=1 Tax=Thermomonosporaceae TaxID=2012 RepID=UPI00255B3CBB|nr:MULTISPECIES: PP2C family protein-serine/threonine phosphatase [Thermomonosporaceae]MDL4772931.1 PP2C family protein-serine/threonine phosphatase [Actinomadura xylanilytica]
MLSRRGRPHAWSLMVVTVEAAIALADAASAAASPVGLLLVGPLLAAVRLTARATTVIATVAITLAVALPGLRGTWPLLDLDHAAQVLGVAIGGVWSALIARSRSRAAGSLARMTHIAELAQRAIVHPLPSRLGDTRLAMRSRSASDHALVGGDLHDAVVTSAGARLVLGDVKGHGLDAVQLAAAVLSAFRQTAAAEPDLVRLAHAIDGRIKPELGPEDFVTLLLADFVPGEVRLVNCGHPPPVRVGRVLELMESPEPSPPLGLSPDPRLHRVRLRRNQRLLLYTDGLTDARDADGTSFPLCREQVRAALAAPDLEEGLEQLLDLLYQHAGDPTGDDLTLILLQPDLTTLPAAVPDTPVTRSSQQARPPVR